MKKSRRWVEFLRQSLCLTLSVSLLGNSIPLAHAGETISYFHNDLVGSPVLATDVNGIQVWKESYRPYGDRIVQASTAPNNKLWFAGESQDVDTGLSYLGARYYDPTLGRFMGVDPEQLDFNNLHSFNRYAYASNNPNRFVDPTGEYALAIAFIAIAAIFVAAAVCDSCREGMVKLGDDIAQSTDGKVPPVPVHLLPGIPVTATPAGPGGGDDGGSKKPRFEKSDSGKLKENLINDGQTRPLDSKGVVYDAHHLSGGGNAQAAEKALEVLQKFGIGRNSAQNGVFLPRSFNRGLPASYYERAHQLLTSANSERDALEVLKLLRKELLQLTGVTPP